MTLIEHYTPGQMCWVDLSAHDMTAAKRFYGGLFGWTAEDANTRGGPPYANFLYDGKLVAGLGRMPDEMMSRGIPPLWNSYIAVDDCAEVEARIAAAGGQVLMSSTAILDAGHLSVVQDPTGASFMLWQPGAHPGAQRVNEPGSWAWNELATRDIERARRFYGEVFGWAFEPVPGGPTKVYGVKNEGRDNAHFIEMNAQWAEMPPTWSVYFSVADCEASCAQAEALGGAVVVPPTDIPQGRFAVLRDDQGSHFYVMKIHAPA